MLMLSPIAASLSSAAAVVDELDRHRVLSRDRLDELMMDFPGGGPLALAEFLIARGELSTYQAERTLCGQGRSLLVGPYRIIEPHHIGAFGPIFRAVKGESRVALRVLPLRSLWQAKQAKQLVRTLTALQSVPAVVPLIDADSANGCHYLAWPLAAGELLADRIANLGPFRPVPTIELLGRLAAALAACHAAQVIHGLLTPQAVCVGADGSPRVLEVGAGMLLAKNLASDDSLFDTMSESIAVAGAFDFASPEWIADPARATPAADQYSLGCLGCFVLTGTTPIPGTEPEWPLGMPRELIDILNRMRQPDPAARFSGLDEAWAALAEIGTVGNGMVETDHGDEASQYSDNDIHGPDESLWTAPESLSRPVERDNTEESIHFDLPEHEEEPFPVPSLPGLEARETPPPAQWRSVASPMRPAPTPPPPPPRSNKKREIDALPALPAAPLPPLDMPTPSSSTWEAVNGAPHSKKEPELKTGSAIWKRMKRKVLFWQTTGDTVQISAFGPSQTRHSESPKLTVFLHSPSAASSVATLARAFHHDAVLLGTGPLSQLVNRGERLEIHVSIEHASASSPLGGFTWQGQPHRLGFDFVIPWESPVGVAAGIVSVGRDQVRIGKLEFGLTVRDGAV